MQQRQRVGDLEEELDVLKKQLRAAQSKVIDQVGKLREKCRCAIVAGLVERNRKFESKQRRTRRPDSDVY